eukprot:Em0001g1201a
MRQHQSPQCFRCGRTHQPETCWFRDQQCRSCKKVGHAERVCRSRKRVQEVKGSAEPYRSRDKSLREMDKEEDETNLFWGTIKTKNNGTDQWKGGHALVVEVMVDSLPLKMELDTGAAVSLLPYALYRERYSHLSLQNTKTCLRTYTGERIYPKGEVLVKVKKGRQETTLPLLVVEGNGPPLLGRDWLAHIPIDWKEIKTLSRGTADEKLASLKAQYPRLWKERLEVATGIKAKLHLKEGATPVFMKARPVPYSVRKKVEDELNRLQELGIISPVSWSEWATPIVVVPKQDGAIRLCGDFKVSVNPALKIDMYPLPKVGDIFATLGKGELYSKIDLLQAYNQLEVEVASRNLLTINTHKGLFQYSRVPFGIAAAPAIWQRTLELVLQGIPRVHCLLDDIIIAGRDEEEHFRLLEQVMARLDQYNFTINQQKCKFFQKQLEFCGYQIDSQGLHKTPDKIQAMLEAPRPTSVTQLRSFLGIISYYHRFLPNLSTVLAPLHELLKAHTQWKWTGDCEKAFEEVKKLVASDTVLIHFDPQLPISVACDASAYGLGAVLSQTTKSGEERPVAFASRTLTQTEKGYSQIDKEALALVWGIRKFHQYVYGHKFTLITDHQPLTMILDPHKSIPVTTAARLQRYAAFLGGLPLTVEEGEEDEASQLFVKLVEHLPVTYSQLREATQKDPTLSKVLQFALNGWPVVMEDNQSLKPYFDRQYELSVEQGCLLTPLHPWEFPGYPWRRIHLDFAGPIEGKMLLVIVDAYSKWPEVVVMEEVTAERTVRFMKLNNIKHITTSPYHPATNGLAERFVQTLKQSLRVSKKEDRTLQHRVATFLINYRNARHSTTEESPAQLMIGRELRSRLHLLKPNLKDTVMKAQTAQVQRRTATPDRTFEIGEWVMVRDYRRAAKEKWQQAVVKTKLGCKTYLVEMRGGGVWKRHVDQMIKDHGSVLTERETTELDPEEEMTGKETNGWGPQIKEGRSVQQAPTEKIQTLHWTYL